MLMIDWITAKIPFHFQGDISDGEIISVGKSGEIDYLVKKRLSVRGSYDGSITIRSTSISDGNTCEVEISGNPVKFLQGHNLFGSCDLPNLVIHTVLKLADLLGSPQPDDYLNLLYGGIYTISRVDINSMYYLGSRADVLAYLYAMGATTRTRSQGPITKGSTVYLNKTSKRWQFKFYSKGQEIALPRNRKQGSIVLPPELVAWADPTFRAELTLKSKELIQSNIQHGFKWHKIDVGSLFEKYATRIEMKPQTTQYSFSELASKIKPRSAAMTYQSWLDGYDVRILPRNTFYTHRKALLEFGIDIAIPCPPIDKKPSNVVPFRKVLELKPAVLPEWVYSSEYYFNPPKLAADYVFNNCNS